MSPTRSGFFSSLTQAEQETLSALLKKLIAAL